MRFKIRISWSHIAIASVSFAYLLSYYTFLVPQHMVVTATYLDGSSLHVLEPEYRWNHVAIQNTFAPLLWLDQKLRPSYWCWVEIPEDRQKFLHPPFSYDGGFVFPETQASNVVGSNDIGFGGRVGTPARFIQIDPSTRRPLRIQWSR